MRMCAFSVSLLVALAAAGCVRRDGRNSDCKWPPEISGHAPDSRHLSGDAEFAEDLAIRYADTHFGPRTPNYVSDHAYAAARDQCRDALFEEIAREHGVPVGRVSGALGRNRARVEIAEVLPFVLVYCLAATAVARAIWRRYPFIEHGWVPGVVMALFLSLAFAAGSTMLGEWWSLLAESSRIGTGHMSYRVQRLWWGQHRTELFAGSLIVFWLAATQGARHMRSNRSFPCDQALESHGRVS